MATVSILPLQKDLFFTTKASGTGLGLALSQRIINAHQGDIHVTSMPGCGATFTLILPLNPQEIRQNENDLPYSHR
jgi:signal transduction histidine kinase